MEEKENMLPVVQKDKDLLQEGKRHDFIKRIGRVVKGVGIGVGILTAGTFGSVALPMVVPGIAGAALGGATFLGSFSASVYNLYKGTKNIVYREEDDLMFVTRRGLDNTLKIFQSLDSSNGKEVQKLGSAEEKAGFMQMQCLVGLSRFKDSLVNSPYTEREDGTKVYNQEFSTVTHSVNLKTFAALENLGLIEIVKKDDKIGRTLLGKPKERRSLLWIEKKGFDNKEALDEIKDGFKQRDWKKLKGLTKVMEKWTFRLTDKPIDFVDLYAKYQGLIPCETVEEKKGLRSFGLLFNSKHGLLAKSSMRYDIGKDKYGRDVILYDRDEGFGTRVDREIGAEELRQKAYAEGRKLNMPEIRAKAQAERALKNPEGLSEFDLSLRQGVNQKKVEAVIEEHRADVREDLADDGILNNSNNLSVVKTDDKDKDLDGSEHSL